MKRLTLSILVTLAVLLGSAGEGWSAEPDKGLCLAGTKHSHAAEMGKCSDAYERGNYETALQEWKPLAEKGFAPAQTNLGQMYRRGQGVPQDYETAVKWYRLAAEQGFAPAQNSLGQMYRLGKGVPQNDKTAVKWYRLAAEQGHARAQTSLGVMYRRGQGVPQNDKTAVKWYRLAAEQGFSIAQNNLGLMYVKGKGVPQVYKTALKWFRLAAEQGHANAQNNLGQMYRLGRGVSQDYETALKWLILSADKGYKKAKINRDKLETLMTPAQIEKAQELARNFVPQKTLPVIIAQKVTPTVTAKKTPEPKPAKQVAKKTEPKVDQQKRLELARRTQEALEVLGLYSGKLDGIIGVKTKSAIQRWQKRNGYSGTGEVTELQLAKLEQEAITHLAKKKSEPKVAKKKTPKPSPPSKTGTSGSGFFVSKSGHVITNQHIVSDCGEVTVGDNAKKQVTADILETDRRNDLALLKISSMKMASVETKSLIRKLGITVVPLASHGLLRSEDVELGESVLVAGYPYGDIFSNTIKVTGGMVSANRGFGDDTGQFQMDAAVQPGNSGGPIYDENGNIVGVVISQLNKRKFEKIVGSMPENVNFGIKASTVRQFLTSSGLPTKWSKKSKKMSTKNLAKIAKNQTVMVMCHP